MVVVFWALMKNDKEVLIFIRASMFLRRETNMLNALEAQFESMHRSDIKDILNKCEEAIKEACEKGEFACTVSIWMRSGRPESVYQEILKTLNDLGYRTHLTDNRSWADHAPCDQAPRYEDLKISWAVEE